MTRLPKRADPAEGPVAKFAWELRSLQNRMGPDAPSVEDISRREGLPRSTLYAALRGDRLPRREVVAALARSWGADASEWLDRRSAVESLRSSEPDWQLPEPLGRADRGAKHGLSAYTTDLLRGAGAPHQYARGESLFEQDHPSSSVLLIDHGMAKVLATGPDGSHTLLAVRSTGEILGEMSALTKGTHTASAVAATPMTATRISATEFRRLHSENPQLAMDLVYCLADRLREADARRLRAAHYAPDQRLLRVLQELGAHYGKPLDDGSVEIPSILTQNELASLTGTSSVTCARALARLRDGGFVEVAHRRIRLLPRH